MADRNKGVNFNTNTEPTLIVGQTVNSSASNIYLITKEDSRIIFSNSGNKDIFVELQDASASSSNQGFILFQNSTTELDLVHINLGGVQMSARIGGGGSTTLYLTVI